MPPVESISQYQDALLWPIAGYGADGQPTIASITPTPIKCRWKWSRVERLDSQGNTITIDAQVQTTVTIAPGSYLWLGTLAEWTAAGNRGSLGNEVCEVKSVGYTLDIKGRGSQREYGLLRYRDTLPSIA